MWIVGEDLRDNQRLAFPLYNAAVSFDVGPWLKELEEENRKVRFGGETAINEVKAKLSSRLAHLNPADIPEVRRIDDEKIHEFEAELERKIAELDRKLKSNRMVEALIYFNGQMWPLRSVRIDTSWDSVRSYTKREEFVDTSQLPDITK